MKTKWDIVICVCIMAVLGIFVLDLKNISPAARVYPSFVLGGSYIMAAVVIAGYLTRKNKGGEKAPLDPGAVKRIVIFMLIILAYIVLLYYIGYIPATLLFSVCALLYQGNRSKTVLIILPAALTASIYLLFSLLLFVSLPTGKLFEQLF